MYIVHASDPRFSLQNPDAPDRDLPTRARRVFSFKDISPAELAVTNHIFLDEAVFFKGVTAQAETWANAGKWVLIGLMKIQLKRNPFAFLNSMVALSERVVVLKGTCTGSGCERKSVMAVPKEELEDGDLNFSDLEKFSATCRKCFDIRDTPKLQSASTLSSIEEL